MKHHAGDLLVELEFRGIFPWESGRALVCRSCSERGRWTPGADRGHGSRGESKIVNLRTRVGDPAAFATGGMLFHREPT